MRERCSSTERGAQNERPRLGLPTCKHESQGVRYRGQASGRSKHWAGTATTEPSRPRMSSKHASTCCQHLMKRKTSNWRRATVPSQFPGVWLAQRAAATTLATACWEKRRERVPSACQRAGLHTPPLAMATSWRPWRIYELRREQLQLPGYAAALCTTGVAGWLEGQHEGGVSHAPVPRALGGAASVCPVGRRGGRGGQLSDCVAPGRRRHGGVRAEHRRPLRHTHPVTNLIRQHLQVTSQHWEIGKVGQRDEMGAVRVTGVRFVCSMCRSASAREPHPTAPRWTTRTTPPPCPPPC